MTALNRLSFVLPDFTRIAWTSDRARAAWEPRIQRISHAWSRIEWLSVAKGIRRGCLARMSDAQFHATAPQWAAHDVSALGLAREGAPRSTYSASATKLAAGRPSVLCVGLARYEDLAALQQAVTAHDDERLGELLGYPACCRRFFRRVWIDGAHVDTTWHMAVNSGGAARSDTRIDVTGPALANILWRWMGVRAVPHLPCRFDCAPTAALAERLREVGIAAGFVEEMDWVREILSWPVEWSALHGIAEVSTPILKVSTRTDATSIAYSVRRSGSSYPPEGATGLRFPYRPSGVQKAAAQPIAFRAPDRSWQYTENGFASLPAMDQAHAPLVRLAAETLVGGGAVLDLGCGNAMLLKKICERVGPGAVPCGIDLRQAHIDRARTVLPHYASNFQTGDMFGGMFAGNDRAALRRRYRLVMLGVNRLLEAPEERARQLLEEIRQWTEYLLIYSYPSAGSASDLDAVADRLGLRIAIRTPDAIVSACP